MHGWGTHAPKRFISSRMDSGSLRQPKIAGHDVNTRGGHSQFCLGLQVSVSSEFDRWEFSRVRLLFRCRERDASTFVLLGAG